MRSVNNPGAAVSDPAYTLTGELASEGTVIEGQGYTGQHGYDVHGRRDAVTTYPGGRGGQLRLRQASE